jgi:beta-aspartyl-dipeptidase (metallo-type)
MPVFDERGKLTALAVGDIKNLYLDWRESIREGLSIEEALKLVTINPAQRAGIHRHKGSLEIGKDADLLILDRELNIETVIAKGQVMVHQGHVLVKGAFE